MAVVYNHFPRIAKGLKPGVQKVVKDTAKQLQSEAQSNAPVDTGFMQENVYVSTWDSSDYGTGGIAAPGDSYLLPEEKPSDDTSAVVGAAANYSIYQEMGTRFMPAQPFFYQSAEDTRPFFEDALIKMLLSL